jgi:hypothetical protein
MQTRVEVADRLARVFPSTLMWHLKTGNVETCC